MAKKIKGPMLRSKAPPNPPPAYSRGFTAQMPAPPDQRPPDLGQGVFNEFAPKVRGATMSPPTFDTQEPRLSHWIGRPIGPLAKRGPRAR